MFRITRSQWKAISSLCVNFSAVFLASLVIPVFTGEFDFSKWYVVLSGIIGTVAFSYLSLLAAQEGKL